MFFISATHKILNTQLYLKNLLYLIMQKGFSIQSLFIWCKARPMWVVFILFFITIFNHAFTLLLEYDFAPERALDINTYMGMANGDFDQSEIRRYRLIIPLLAQLVYKISGWIFTYIKPYDFNGQNFGLCFSFLLVNTAFVSLSFTFLFKIWRKMGASLLICVLLGSICISARWTAYIAGLPLVDSLYLLSLCMLCFACVANDYRMGVACLYVGILAKESFVFFIPILIVIFFKNRSIILHLIGALALAYCIRYGIDSLYNLYENEATESIMATVHTIPQALQRALSFHGLYELFSVIGFWWACFILLLHGNTRKYFINNLKLWHILYFVAVIIHALLSADLSRMYYLWLPLLTIWIVNVSNEVDKYFLVKI
jgi:hypothetical protein